MALIFLAMLVLAAAPGISSLTVAAQSAACGFRHGLFVSIGIVLVDLCFILLAVSGLALLAGALGKYFVMIKYAGGIYLLWLACGYWRRAGAAAGGFDAGAGCSLWSSFLAGLLVTLGDYKAIFFYFGFFPLFIDGPQLAVMDVGIILFITVMAVGGTKLAYAGLACRGRELVAGSGRLLNRVIAAALLLVSLGLFYSAWQ